MTRFSNRLVWITLTVVFCFGLQTTATATTMVDVGQVLGTTQFVEGITGFQTDGGDMAGMSVTAIFDSGLSITAPWTTMGDAGEATGSGLDVNNDLLSFRLTQSGDTFTNQWSLTNTSEVGAEAGLLGLVLDGFPGDAVFDRTFLAAIGTPDSSTGKDFFSDTDLGFDLRIVATYVNQVAIQGFGPVGDIFRALDIRFLRPLFNVNPTLFFVADTDSIGLPPGQVPEPGTLLLVGVGLVALYRRRRG